MIYPDTWFHICLPWLAKSNPVPAVKLVNHPGSQGSDFGLWTSDFGLWNSDFRLPTPDFRPHELKVFKAYPHPEQFLKQT